MCNKKCHQSILIIKILLTIIVLATLYIPPNAYSQLCDRDGVCEEGEDKNNCVFDCMVAANNKNIKLHGYPASVAKVTLFKSDGTLQEILDISEVKNFLKGNIDLSLNSFLTESIPYIIYRSSSHMKDLSNDPSNQWYSEWLEYDQHEEWFVHQEGASQTKDNRVLRKYYGPYLFNLDPEWSVKHADYTKSYLEQDPQANGVFQDESCGYINSTLYAYNIVNEKQTIEEVVSDGCTYKFVRTNYPIFVGEDFPCMVSCTSDPSQIYSIYGIWAEVNMIFLEETAPAAGTPVTVSYYGNATIPQDIKDNWKGSMSEVLKTIRETVGGKLFLYNGFSTAVEYDNDFLQYADGGMLEGIFHTPWRHISDTISEAAWKLQLDKLVDISVNKRKIFLVQTGATIDEDTTEAQIRKAALFCFTSYLLGKGDYAYFMFYLEPESFSNFLYFDYWGANIGSPLEAYHVRGNFSGANIYEREFDNALVLVNPSDITVTVALGSSYLTLDGVNVENVQLEGKSGIILLKYSAGVTTTTTSVQTATTTTVQPATTTIQPATTTTSVQPATTTTVQPATTTIQPATTTISVQPATTTTVQPVTTTTAISGGGGSGGGGGGGGNPTTTTTSVQPTSTTTVQPNTTTTVIAECTTDTDCDDNLFCNGVERCDNGICIQGSNPCQAGQICNESKDQCKNVRTKPGTSFPVTIRRPVSTDEQTNLLIIKTTEDNYFDRASSSVIFANSGDNFQGVKLDTIKKAFKLKTWFGSFIFLPVRVHKQATVGQWEILINTEVSGRDPIEERVISTFIIK